MIIKQKTLIVTLAVLLIIAVGYIIYVSYNNWQEQRELDIFQNGLQFGYEQAIIQIVQQTMTCQTVPLRAGNQTISVVAVDCLQLPEPSPIGGIR